eukprot:3863676-Amphidinium_carterae.1
MQTPTATFAHANFKAQRHLLASHKRAAHNVFNPLSLRLLDNSCPTCGTHLGSRSQILQHLANRPDCALHTFHNLSPLSTEEHKETIHARNSNDTTFTRCLIPKRGPIPIIAGMPQSQSEAPINPFH